MQLPLFFTILWKRRNIPGDGTEQTKIIMLLVWICMCGSDMDANDSRLDRTLVFREIPLGRIILLPVTSVYYTSKCLPKPANYWIYTVWPQHYTPTWRLGLRYWTSSALTQIRLQAIRCRCCCCYINLLWWFGLAMGEHLNPSNLFHTGEYPINLIVPPVNPVELIGSTRSYALAFGGLHGNSVCIPSEEWRFNDFNPWLIVAPSDCRYWNFQKPERWKEPVDKVSGTSYPFVQSPLVCFVLFTAVVKFIKAESLSLNF